VADGPHSLTLIHKGAKLNIQRKGGFVSDQRDNMLQAIRSAVAAGNRAGAAPHPERDGVGYQGAGGDAVERFCREFAAAGGVAHRAADAKDAVDIIVSLVQAKEARRVLLGGGLEALPLADALARTGVEIVRADEGDKAEYFAADVGVSGVDHLIAETGSVVMLTRSDQPRSLSLLPPVHIAVARHEQIVEDLFDLFEASAIGAAPLPACVSIITGPSKTGDIELKLVTGVHGPGEIHVVLW
jgi:L-lactate dehydrogenase complex protein LldG